MKLKIRHIIICLILLTVMVFTNVMYNNVQNTKSTTTSTYTNNAVEYMKKRKVKKKVKKTKKKVKKTKKKKVTTSRVATASVSTYHQYAQSYGGYDNAQMGCLINLWNRESGWNPNSKNSRSGACGIPQALPCNKIKKQQGSNSWDAQIRWGIGYINYKYGSPCGAWKHFTKKGWY